VLPYLDPETGTRRWLPDDFPTPRFGLVRDRHLAICDGLILDLIGARRDLDDRGRAPAARALIEQMFHALDGVDAERKLVRQELLVSALDEVTSQDGYPDDGFRALGVCSIIGSQAPELRPPIETALAAVELWTQTKRREARTQAVRELARALDCDAKDGPTLMTMLRQARQRLRERREDARRK
jgi:hypothetical protein